MTCNCGRPTRDDAYVCETCLSGLFRALGEVPWLTRELDTTIAKQRAAGSSDGARSTETPMPFHIAASDARSALRQAMFTWIKFCTEEKIRHRGGRDGWPLDNLPAMSRWLMCRVDGLAFSDLGFDACEEITNAIAQCRRVIDRPAERRYAGPCECGRDLYHKPGAVEVKCRDCERVYVVAELNEWMRDQVLGRLVTAQEGSGLLCKFNLETSVRAIYDWDERGRVIAHAGGGRRKLFLFDDLLKLATEKVSQKGLTVYVHRA
jgi:hypothetical protein